MRVSQWLKPALWGAVVGAVAIMIIGFSWWGWVLGGTAERMAQERAHAALVAALTPICVERFMQQPDATVKLADLRKTASWQQSQYVAKGGWATVGSSEPNPAVANACAQALTQTKT